MSRSETSETDGNRPPYPGSVGSFASLLSWHLYSWGTRASGTPDKPGKPWSNKEFAGHFRNDSELLANVVRKISNWTRGVHPPQDIRFIEQLLFGNVASLEEDDPYKKWRVDLRHAHRGPEPSSRIGTPIPPVTKHFLGRTKDLAILLEVLLARPESVAVLVQGSPGIGKTSLTQAIGNHPDVICRFGENNRWFVPLDAVTSAAALQDAIARSVGGDPSRGFDATLALLRRQPGLLVLDNIETPWDPKNERRATEEILATLTDIPGLTLLASFRGGDRVGGPAWALVHPVAHLDPPDDAELFCRIAQRNFSDDPYLPRFMTALGGIPLAIVLVAARAHGRSALSALWAQWKRIGAALAVHPDFDAGRLTSVPHSIELSLTSSRLTPAAYRLFCLLGQLPAGIAEEDRDELLAWVRGHWAYLVTYGRPNPLI
jgi:hypothetical protein